MGNVCRTVRVSQAINVVDLLIEVILHLEDQPQLDHTPQLLEHLQQALSLLQDHHPGVGVSV